MANNDIEEGIIAQPIEISLGDRLLMNRTYSRESGVKCISLFDFVLALLSMTTLIYMESNLWFIGFTSALIIMGYVGAKTYNSCLLNGYIFYLSIQIMEYVYFMYQYSIFGILMIIFNFYIIQYVYKLKSSIKSLSNDQLQMLRDGYVPINPVMFVYY